MEYAVIAVPAAPLRRKPGQRKEMVNQLLFGEFVKVIREKAGLWVKVKSLHDDYEGWLTASLLRPVSKEMARQRIRFVVTDQLGQLLLGENRMFVPGGASLPQFKDGQGLLGEEPYTFSGFYRDRDEQVPDAVLVCQLARGWLNAPYLWGGRTLLGVDCSGFVQVIFKMAGIDLPRDAWQQAQMGQVVKKLADAKAGDLAFFDNREDIVHTGILLGNHEIIHAQGKVRIDDITNKGIINRETGKRTARLRAIRRVIGSE